MQIVVGNSYAKIIQATVQEEAFLREYLTFRSSSPQGKDTEHCLLSSGRMFPAGLAARVVSAARERGMEVAVAPRRPSVVPLAVPRDGLWPHQVRALEAIWERRRGIIQHGTGCLSGDTVIEINRSGESTKVRLDHLVHMSNGGTSGGKRWKLEVPTRVRYRAADGYVRLGLMKSAWSSGVQTTYTIATACGKTIRATSEHRFLTATGWKPAKELACGSEVYVLGGCPVAASPKKYKRPQYLVVSNLHNHPHATRRNISKGSTHSVAKHRLLMEAALNGVPFADYINSLKPGNATPDYLFLDPKIWAVHHKDEDSKNNDLSNLEILTHSEHYTQHGKEGGWRHVTECTVMSRIISISQNEPEETYDIEMADDPHNFVANGFVVHNSGKGHVIAALVAEINAPTLVLVTSIKLLHEMYDRIRKVAEITPGRFGDSYKELKRPVIVATVNSAIKIPKAKMDSFVAILADECHASGGNTYYQVVLSCANAEVRIGFSGTPLHRSDKKSIYTIGAFGDVIDRYTPAQSAIDGVTAKAHLTMVPMHHTPVSAAMGYVDWEKRAIAKNTARNNLILRLIATTPAPRIVFVRTHEHQTILMKQLGNTAVFVNDKVPMNDANRRVRQLVNGTVDTLISTPIYRQGIDIPEIATVIQASGGQSTVDIIQKVGRGSRRHLKDGTTKDDFYVFDILDRGCGCTGRQQHKGCEWLEKHSRARKLAYEKFGYVVKTE